MKKLKTRHLIIITVILPIVGVLSTLPEVIPTWKTTQKIIGFTILAITAPFAVILIIKVWKLFIQKMRIATSIILSTLTTLVIVGYILFSSIFVVALCIDFFGATLNSTLDYPEHNITIYVYNSSFLFSKSTTLKIRDGWLPVMKTLKRTGHAPSSLNIVREGDIIEFKHYNDDVPFRFNLRTGKLIE